jgi:uncharacterized protein (DUF1501 family)
MSPVVLGRRHFIKLLGSAGLGAVLLPIVGRAALADELSGDYRRLLILVELKGGNDGLNTIVPYADAAYHGLRPRLGVAREAVLQLDERTGLHPSLEPLMALWQSRELAIVQGLGYPQPNLSHFRSIEIWDTASKSDEYLPDGWLARTFAAQPPPAGFAADGVVVGSPDMGPLSGTAPRVIALSIAEQFLHQARLASPARGTANGALAHVLKVERDIAQSASRLTHGRELRNGFPADSFGKAVHTACQLVGGGSGVAALRLTLGGFDTHQRQAGMHAGLLKALAEGLVALRAGLTELGRWQDTLVLTYSEFGRRPRENQSGGTDHGTAAAHLVLGGRVRGGLYGAAPELARLDGNGNLSFAVDFRALYASVLERWWGVASAGILGGRFEPLPLVRS